MAAQLIEFSPAPNPNCEEHRMSDELQRILANRLLTPFFMPIINTATPEIIGYEALIRGPADSPLHAPANLFAFAHKAGRLLQLELLCRELSIARFIQLKLPGKLFLNVTPNTLLEQDFRAGETLALLQRAGFPPERLVLEITEQLPITDYRLMRETTDHYRAQGFQVALDDLGAGYAGLRSWSELRPQYVKIDRHFIEGIDQAPIKQEFVRSIMEVARSIECRVIAEGIEQAAEHHFLNRIGLHRQQGFYFARPHPLPTTQLPTQLSDGPPSHRHPPLGPRLSDIASLRPGIHSHCNLGDAARRFRQHPELQSIAVLEEGRALGLLHRDTCLNLYLAPFGRELYERRSLLNYVDRQALMLEERVSLEQVSQHLARLDRGTIRTDFIITRDGSYLGMGAIVDLLKLVTELQLRNARHANPLTQLPGSVPTHEEIDRRLAEGAPFSLAYIDIDHFKGYNDRYGYQRGDAMIQLLADCLRQCGQSGGLHIGHIGGDDFLLLQAGSEWRQPLLALQQRFAERVRALYDPADRARGWIAAQDRSGTPCRHPLATLSIGVALPDPARCRSHHPVAALASDAKLLAKKQPGDSLVLNRRRGPDRSPGNAPDRTHA